MKPEPKCGCWCHRLVTPKLLCSVKSCGKAKCRIPPAPGPMGGIKVPGINHYELRISHPDYVEPAPEEDRGRRRSRARTTMRRAASKAGAAAALGARPLTPSGLSLDEKKKLVAMESQGLLKSAQSMASNAAASAGGDLAAAAAAAVLGAPPKPRSVMPDRAPGGAAAPKRTVMPGRSMMPDHAPGEERPKPRSMLPDRAPGVEEAKASEAPPTPPPSGGSPRPAMPSAAALAGQRAALKMTPGRPNRKTVYRSA